MELTLDNPSLTPFKDKVDFSIYIETYALQHGTGLLGSILQYCEDADVDLEDCVKLITPSLRDKIEIENQFPELLTELNDAVATPILYELIEMAKGDEPQSKIVMP